MAAPLKMRSCFRAQVSALSAIAHRQTYDISWKAVTSRQLRLSSSSPISSHSMSPTPALPQQSDQIARHESKGRLSRRTCMVTGGTSGIGYAIAERFLQEGASTIILVGRSEERLRGAAEKLAPSTNLSTISQKVQLLVGDVGEAGGWMRELEQNMVNVDVLVNAAGISVSNLLTKLDLSDISSVLRTNLEGAILTSRAFLRAAIRSRVRNRKASPSEGIPASKCIINISSLLALKAGTGAVPYAASKAGLLGLTRALAAENATSFRNMAIRCNAIVPGYIATPMIEGFSPGEVERLTSLIPLQRFGDPKEIADAAVFLAQNEYANNCVLNLDGGLSAV